MPNYLSCSGVAFLPLQDVSPRAGELVEALERRISERASSSPGLQAQLALQLEMLKNRGVPDMEIVVFPFNPFPDGEYIGSMQVIVGNR